MVVNGISPLATTTLRSISAGTAILAMAGVVTTAVLIFTISLTVLWPVLIGCSCIAVGAAIVFIVAHHVGAKSKITPESKSGPPHSSDNMDDRRDNRHFSKFILPRNWLPRPYPGLPPHPSGIFEQFVFACVNL
ncbi:MAG: hypothetical protein LBT98_02725, partial [Puniceicoccales bacterium]|nr:hypothetical protein [Puniceicoccales bacterium]